ncbi:GAF domain-containing protein [soil metagenome]
MAFHEQLVEAVGDRRGVAAADRLCEACVTLFDLDAAAISLIFDGANSGTLGVSGGPARVYDELQFTLGEGPCLDSIAKRSPVLVADLAEGSHRRWPLYSRAMLDLQVRAVFALPLLLAGEYVGALDLFRNRPGRLEEEYLAGAVTAAELAGAPLLDVMAIDLQAAIDDRDGRSWAELNLLSRAEVSQATGMLVAQLDIEPAEALIRLRAHAYANGRSATDVARDILDRRLTLEAD